MRLIDADALKEELNSWAVDLTKSKFPHYIKDDADCIIDNAPTIDAVPVVRCGDCKYLRLEPTAAICELFVYDSHYMICQQVKNARDFCSYGERRDDDGQR